MDEQQAVRIAAKLLEARQAARDLFGARYHEKVKPYMEIVQQAAKNREVSNLDMAEQMARDLVDAGKSPLMVLAAVVELTEPSKPSTPTT